MMMLTAARSSRERDNVPCQQVSKAGALAAAASPCATWQATLRPSLRRGFSMGTSVRQVAVATGQRG